MNTKWLSGLFGLILFASSGAVFIGGCGGDEWLTLQACMENAVETGMLKRYAAKRGIQILGDKKLERMQSGSR